MVSDISESSYKQTMSLKEWSERLESLLEVSLTLNSTLRLEEVLQNVMQQAMKVMLAEAGSLWLLENEHVIPKVAGGPKADALKGLKLKKGEGIAGSVIEEQEPVLVSDVRNDPNWASRFDQSTGFITRTMMCVPLVVKEKSIGSLQLLNKKDSLFGKSDLRLAMAFASQAAMVIENSRLFTNQKKMFLSFIKAFSSTIDARDPYTAGHTERVSQYSMIIGRNMELSAFELEKLQEAALLHDVGKIGIRDDILLHQGPLSDEAWEKLKQHPAIGNRILSSVEPTELVVPLCEGALYHQEKYDGTGYPSGATGEGIPLFARIIAIADTYDAMTTDRPYRKGLPQDVALAEIEKHAGSQFDPKLVEVFLNAVHEEKQSIQGG